MWLLLAISAEGSASIKVRIEENVLIKSLENSLICSFSCSFVEREIIPIEL